MSCFRRATPSPPWLTLGALALVAGTGLAGGGYFATTWGWPTLAAAWAAALAVALRPDTGLGWAGASAVLLLGGLAVWTAASAFWSLDVTESALEAQRTAVYVAALLAALLWARQRPQHLVHGVWAAAVLLCGWALVTRLVPDRFGITDPISGYRLSEPIGYWNALGLLAAMGIVLALGIGARVAAAAIPLLSLTLYFTFSRGAWVALFAGISLLLALDVHRLRRLTLLAAVAPWAALLVWRAASSPALTTTGFSVAAMAHDGHRVGLELLAAMLASAATAWAVIALEPRIAPGPRVRRAAAAGAAALAVAAIVAGLVHYGSPVTIASRAWNSFSGDSPAMTTNLNSRLFNLSGTGRTAQWRVAWLDVERHPLLGSGAGSFETEWFRHRPVPSKVRDAHNLYLETLAELGPLGLALLATALALPLVAAVRGRRRPLVPAAAGAYVAFLLHATIDWDWEIAAVTLAAVLCAAALLAEPAPPLRRPGRRAALAAAVLLAVTGLYTIASQLPMSQLGSATADRHWRAAERHARRAAALAPWSADPWLQLGEAELNAGRLAHARSALRKAAAKGPNDWTVWADLARTTTGRERTEAAARAAALNPLGATP